jgi:hypothetical protein
MAAGPLKVWGGWDRAWGAGPELLEGAAAGGRASQGGRQGLQPSVWPCVLLRPVILPAPPALLTLQGRHEESRLQKELASLQVGGPRGQPRAACQGAHRTAASARLPRVLRRVWFQPGLHGRAGGSVNGRASEALLPCPQERTHADIERIRVETAGATLTRARAEGGVARISVL